jgi:AcrR family transcriptional regulator
MSRYATTGRIQQKARTRRALIAAARDLLADGVDPTVEAAADRAEVSRTTAYRYFANRRELVAATYPEIGAPSLLEPGAPSDPMDRLELVIGRIAEQIREYEPELRAQLRLSLEAPADRAGQLLLRQGRVIRWLEDALAPLRPNMRERDLRRLVLSIRATLGIEAFVWLVDVAGVTADEAAEIMCDSARTLTRAAMSAN